MGSRQVPSLLQGAPPAPRPRVLIVSETRLYREGLAEALGRGGGLTVCGHAPTAEAALQAVADVSPEVVLLDAASPDGVALVAAIGDASPGVRTVVFALAELSERVIPWAEAGAAGYIPESTPLDEVAPIVVGIMAGSQSCAPPVASALMRRLRELSEATARRTDEAGAGLTTRERQIAVLINDGLSNKQIARRLDVGVATIKSHVHNLLAKLDIQRRGQVTARLRPSGWGEEARQPPIRGQDAGGAAKPV